MTAEASAPAVPLYGLIVAGGRSRRMGCDKAALDYHGKPQVEWLYDLLASFCPAVRVSVSVENAGMPACSGLPTVIDDGKHRGPVAGLLAAWESMPAVSWLTVAVDMPFVDRETLEALVAGRASHLSATAFRHADDGVLEPLCTVWEAAARAPLQTRAAGGDASLARALEALPTRALVPPEGRVLSSVNTPEEYRAARDYLAGR